MAPHASKAPQDFVPWKQAAVLTAGQGCPQPQSDPGNKPDTPVSGKAPPESFRREGTADFAIIAWAREAPYDETQSENLLK